MVLSTDPFYMIALLLHLSSREFIMHILFPIYLSQQKSMRSNPSKEGSLFSLHTVQQEWKPSIHNQLVWRNVYPSTRQTKTRPQACFTVFCISGRYSVDSIVGTAPALSSCFAKSPSSPGFLLLSDNLISFSDSCIPTSLMQATDYLYCINGHFSKVVAIITVLKFLKHFKSL